MNEWRYNVNCMLARDLPLEKLGIETLPWDTHIHPWNLHVYPSTTSLEKYWNLAMLCVFIPAFHTTTAAAATPRVKEGKIHGSWTSQGSDRHKAQTAQKHTQAGAGTCSIHIEPFLLPTVCWHTENWQQSEIQGKMQPKQTLQEHSLGPDTFHSEQTS